MIWLKKIIKKLKEAGLKRSVISLDGTEKIHDVIRGEGNFKKALNGIRLLKENGIVSFIATNNWITSFGASKFRNKVNKEAKFDLFFDFGNYKVFDTAGIQTMIYIMRKNYSENN